MQKDFKIGLAIGVTIAAAACIWVATFPNLSARARALKAASSKNPSPEIAPVTSQPFTQSQSNIEASQNPSIENPVSSIETPNLNAERSPQNAERQRMHIVQKGETLSSISMKYYGNSNQWSKIVSANRTSLPDPNRLNLGTKLIIPQ